MTTDPERRIELLKGRWCPYEFVRDYYGIDLTIQDSLWREFVFWMSQRNGESYRDGAIDRYWLETFLQNKRLTSRWWMANQLGMKSHSLAETLVAIENRGPVLRYHTSEQVIGTRFGDDLWNLFPELRTYTPSDHNTFCRRLHEQVEQTFGVRIEPELCATAAILGERQYSQYVDAVALEPLCVRYSVWLDFGKWMTLAPDYCSLKTYLQHEERLRLFVAGARPPNMEVHLREKLLAGAA